MRNAQQHAEYMRKYRAAGRDRSMKVQSAAMNKVVTRFRQDHPGEWRKILRETWDELYPDG